MTTATTKISTRQEILKQPNQVIGLCSDERDALIVSMRKVENKWVVVSRYAEPIWWLSGATTNTIKADTKLDFTTIPHAFQSAAKAVMYRLMRRGRQGQKRPGAVSMCRTLSAIRLFLEYLQTLGISSLAEVSPLA